MRFPRRSRGLSSSLSASIAVVSLAILFGLMRLFAPGLLLRIAAPAFVFGNELSASVGSVFTGSADAKVLAAKNVVLAAENQALAAENRTLKERLADTVALIGTTSPRKAGITAGVLERPPVAAYDTLIVGAGSGQGVRRGMEAFGAGGVPIGTVSAVNIDYARVTLFSAPGVATAAWAGPTRIPITLTGTGAGTYSARVPQGASVAAGDAVFLPGPGAIPVGTIKKAGGAASDPFTTLYIQSGANPFSITWVALYDTGSELASTTLAVP